MQSRGWLLFLFALCLLSCNDQDQQQTIRPGVRNISAVENPDPQLRFRGKMKEAFQWEDKLGENVLITSVQDAYSDKDIDGMESETVELFAVHYVKTDTGYRALWRINDLVKQCEFDITCQFIPGSTTITDLDSNGIAETKVQYKLACRSDVLPSTMKIIMHEGAVKYALRGEMWVPFTSNGDTTFSVTENNVNLAVSPPSTDDDYDWIMGRYKDEKDFEKAPPEFIVFARKEWLKHARETFGEDSAD